MKAAIVGCAALLCVSAWSADAAEYRVPDDVSGFVDQATLVAAGRIEAGTARKTQAGDSWSTSTLWAFRIARCFKGPCRMGATISVETLGGSVGGDSMVVPGVASFEIGREYVLLLEPGGGGWRVLHQALGEAAVDLSGPLTSSLLSHDQTDDTFASRLRRRFGLMPPELPGTAPLLAQPAEPVRWRYMTDPPSIWSGEVPVVQTGPADAIIGDADSRAAIVGAARAWVIDSGIGLSVQPVAPGSSSKGWRCEPGVLLVEFNDPLDQISDPVNCSGALAIGGFASDGNGRITCGMILFGDNWEGCGFWAPQELALIATHELGHAIGFAHSCETTERDCDQIGLDATMYAYARTGRGAAITVDYDIPTARYVYGPPVAIPTPTPSPSPDPTPNSTPSSSPAPTKTPPLPVRGTVDIRLPHTTAPGAIVDLWPYDGNGVRVCGDRGCFRLDGSAMPLSGRPDGYENAAAREVTVEVSGQTVTIACEVYGFKHWNRVYCVRE